MKCQFCTDLTLRPIECLLPAARAIITARETQTETAESIQAEGWDFQDFPDKIEAARVLLNTHPRPADFVEFIDETAEVAVETCDTKLHLETYIRKSWDYDDARRRNAFGGKFEAFRQHVLNVLDANYPSKNFA